MTLSEAAKEINVPASTIHRYARAHSKFRLAMDKAQDAGKRARIAATSSARFSESTGGEMPMVDGVEPAPDSFGDPAPHTIEAAEIMGMDVDLVDDVDVTGPLVPGLPPLTMLNVLAWHWKTMHDTKEPPILRKSSSEIITTWSVGPAMAAQQRRNARAEREESAVIDVSASDSDDPTTGEGMVFLELPSNGSEAPGHGPRPIDAEVVR